jgi:transposase
MNGLRSSPCCRTSRVAFLGLTTVVSPMASSATCALEHLGVICRDVWSVHHMLQPLRPWRRAGVWGRIIDALAAAHDAAVQMIDTSIVRVHQHGACITRNRRQSTGRSRGGLTSKIHTVVDSNGLPVRLALSPGEAHDVRLAGKLLSRLTLGSMLLADLAKQNHDLLRAKPLLRHDQSSFPKLSFSQSLVQKSPVRSVRGEWDVSIRRTCSVFEVDTSTYHYKFRRAGQAGSNNGSRRFAKPACATAIGAFTSCCGTRVGASIKRRYAASIAS